MKILIADDSDTVRLLLRSHLTKLGHEVVEGANGDQALELYYRHQPELDLVILDVIMPARDGYDVAREIRAQGQDEWIPIIFLSGNTESGDLVKGIDAGGDDYLFKPVDTTILTAKMHAMQRIADMRSQLIRANAELARQANLDGLTGIANRRYLDHFLERELQRAKRAQVPLSILLLDVDHFKRFNDDYGHLNGDECLKWVARKISEIPQRPADLTARYGGEEFVCVLPETDRAAAEAIAESIRSAIARGHFSKVAGIDRDVTLSIGVVTRTPDQQMTVARLIELADKALYRAKADGRNLVRVAD